MSDSPSSVVPQFDNQIRKIVIGHETFFSILDVFKYYGDSGNPNRDWGRVKERLQEQGFDVVSQLVEHQFTRSDGKLNRATPVATFNTFLRIAMVSRIKSWESLRQWMADLAEEDIKAGPNASDPTLTAEEYQVRHSLDKVASYIVPLILQTEGLMSRTLTEMLFVVSDKYYKLLISKGFSVEVATQQVQEAITQMAPQVINEVILKELVRLGLDEESAIIRMKIAAPMVAHYIAYRNQKALPQA